TADWGARERAGRAMGRLPSSAQTGDVGGGCRWDNVEGLPVDLGNRRTDIDIQTPIRKFMRCPSAEDSTVMYADLSSENLLKGNYVACFGGGAYIDATPNGNTALSGIFGVVPITQKYPYG